MQGFATIIDISIPISEATAVYPGNPNVRIARHIGATSTHSDIALGSHTGTHVDAPKHVFPDRQGLEAFALSQFVGPATVIDATRADGQITRANIGDRRFVKGERLLFKTRNSEKGFSEFRDDYVSISGDLADELARAEVALVGIDALSVKQRGGKDLRPHTSLLERNIVILEGIDLSSVEAGEYFLACLPLRFSDIDGSPVRALLMR